MNICEKMSSDNKPYNILPQSFSNEWFGIIVTPNTMNQENEISSKIRRILSDIQGKDTSYDLWKNDCDVIPNIKYQEKSYIRKAYVWKVAWETIKISDPPWDNVKRQSGQNS